MLKALRVERGWTRAKFAAALGITPRALRSYETGERRCPGRVVEAAARQLGLEGEAELALWRWSGCGHVSTIDIDVLSEIGLSAARALAGRLR
jgi:transcriptional regulator with XRE-family HTH domain